MSVVLHDGVRALMADEILPSKRKIVVDDYAMLAVIALAPAPLPLPPWLAWRGYADNDLPSAGKALSDGGLWWASIFRY